MKELEFFEEKNLQKLSDAFLIKGIKATTNLYNIISIPNKKVIFEKLIIDDFNKFINSLIVKESLILLNIEKENGIFSNEALLVKTKNLEKIGNIYLSSELDILFYFENIESKSYYSNDFEFPCNITILRKCFPNVYLHVMKQLNKAIHDKTALLNSLNNEEKLALEL